MTDIVKPSEPSRLPWSMTLGELVDQAVARDPQKVYLYFQQHQVTYEGLRDMSLRAANMFRGLGVGHGDRVALFLPNGREFLFSWMGLSRLGAVGVPINTAYKAEETGYILNNAEVSVLVSHHTLLEVANKASQQCPSLRHSLVVGDVADTYSGWKGFWQLLNEAPAAPLSSQGKITPQDVSMLVYTSGTTGNPKGVMITHEMYVAAGQGFATWTGATPEDRFFTCLPYFHANAQYYSTMGSLAIGASLVIEDRFSASRFWDQVRGSGATVVNFIGMMMPVLLKQPPVERDSDNTVRLFYGSPAMEPATLEEFEGRFGAEVIIGFALTECCYGTVEPRGQPHRGGSSGRPRWHPDPRFQNELAIMDGRGNTVPPGEAGEITLKSPAVTPGYWRDPERTAEAILDGRLHTGDLGLLDQDGYLYFVDRKKDVVRRRGENISSQEVEAVIKKHPKVLDCAVIAVPSELGEEEVKAYVVPRVSTQEANDAAQGDLTPEEVVYWCADHLASFKVPRYIELRDDLPRTPSLRVRKDQLRQEREDLTAGCFDRERAGIQLKR